MFLIGLTGSIGTGKSTVSDHLRHRNVPVIDSDQIARQVVRPGTRCYRLIRKEFGPNSIRAEDGEIDRKYIGQVIFGDQEKRRRLNAITHPAIQKRIVIQLFWYYFTFRPYVVLDIPLLFEASKLRRFISYIIVVKCHPEEQLRRIQIRNGYTEQEALARIGSQICIQEKCLWADFVIDNDGPVEETYRQVDELFDRLPRPIFPFWTFRALLLAFYATIMYGTFFMVNKIIYW